MSDSENQAVLLPLAASLECNDAEEASWNQLEGGGAEEGARLCLPATDLLSGLPFKLWGSELNVTEQIIDTPSHHLPLAKQRSHRDGQEGSMAGAKDHSTSP